MGEIYTSGDYQYSVLDDDTVQITRYNGTENDITIPTEIDGKTVTKISDYVFYCNSYIKSVKIVGSTINYIGQDAFSYCSALTEISIAGNNAIINKRAFSDCEKLKSATIEGVIEIGQDTFYNCKNLETVTLSDDVKTIGYYAFNNCSSLKNLKMSNSLISLGKSAFNGCTNLENIVIPNGVTTIPDKAFYNCTSLKSISIGSGCKSIETYAFYNTALEEINVSNKNIVFSSTDGVLYDNTKSTLIMYPKNKNGAFVIPDTVETIEKEAFQYCYNLTSVVMGNNVKTINPLAFCRCEALTNVDFSKSNVEYIGSNAFVQCLSLTNLILPESVKEVADYAFLGCTLLKSVTIPSNVTKIGSYAFGYNYNSGYAPIDGFEIKGYTDTAAEVYANENKLTFTALNNSFVKGDVDGDGIVTINDATCIQKHLAEITTLTAEKAIIADINGDGNITVDDVTLIQQYIANIINKL